MEGTPNTTFTLSDKLNVTIVEKKEENNATHLEFNRQTRNGTSRAVQIAKHMWFTWLDIWHELDEALTSKQEITKHVTENYDIQVRPFVETNGWYVCLVYTSKNRRVLAKCLNLNPREWEVLWSRATEISHLLKRYEACQAPLGTPAKIRATIKQYNWSVDYPTKDSISTTGEWLFDRDFSKAQGNAMRIKLDKEYKSCGILYMDERKIPVPSPYDIAKHVLLCLLQIQLGKLAKNNCQACKQEISEQRSHMNGCLAEWPEIVMAYFDKAKKCVSRQQVTAITYHVLKYLQLPTQFCSIVSDGVIYLIPDSDKINELANDIRDSGYENLVKSLVEHNENITITDMDNMI